jgi:hypothetical protein
MSGRLRPRLTYANVMATVAVFIALGGSSYAALKLPKGSVGATQLRSNAVTSPKVKPGSLLVSDFRRSQRSRLRGPQGPAGQQGAAGAQGPPGPAGTATAYGRVAGFDPTPTIVSASPNVSGVKRGYLGLAGRFCVTFDPPIPAERLKAAVATTYYGPNYPAIVVQEIYCSPGELGVLLHNSGSGQNGDFNFIVP